MPKEILYPIFLECVQYANDVFWENVFEDLSYGKAPFGSRINKNSLTCNFKDKEFNYRIEKKDAEILFNDIYHLLTTKLGLMSQYDKVKKKIDFEHIENDLKDNQKNWINIRKKNIKDLLIEKFVIEKKNQYNLTSNQSKLLLSKIFTGIIFKVIKNKDIIFEDGKIQSIEGISFKNKKVIYERDFYEFENTYRKIIIIDKNLMSDNWKKYLINLKKLNV